MTTTEKLQENPDPTSVCLVTWAQNLEHIQLAGWLAAAQDCASGIDRYKARQKMRIEIQFYFTRCWSHSGHHSIILFPSVH